MSKPSSLPITADSHIYLIDGSGYIFRAYHALPPLSRPSDQMPVGAVHGFCQMLWKLMQDTKEGDQPSHLAVIFDAARENFRNEIYSDYKANRPPPPEDLIPQFSLIRDATKAFGIPCIEQEGYEADDLIATYVQEAVSQSAEVTIVSSDKDLMQLIVPGITMLDTMKNNRRIAKEQVIEKFGVGPEHVVDVQALAGDSVDNIPGVPGIGVKTAAQLISEFGDLDTLLDQADTIKQKKRRENLIEFSDKARMSKELVKLKNDVPVECGLAEFAVVPPEPETLLNFLRDMEFNKLTARIAENLGVDVPKAKIVQARASGFQMAGGAAELCPALLAAEQMSRIASVGVDRSQYETVSDIEALQNWVHQAYAQGYFAFDTETTSLDAMQSELVGVSLALSPNKACYVPLLHHADGDLLDLDAAAQISQIPFDQAIEVLKPILEDEAVLKIGQNLKYDYLVLKKYDITLNAIDDTMLLSYALDAGLGGHGMDELALRHFGHTCIAFKEVAGTGKSQVTFDKVPIDKASKYAAEDADVTLRLWQILKPRLSGDGRTTVYETLDRPLLPILADMEAIGIKVDPKVLSKLSERFAKRLQSLETDIHRLAGEDFNVASPKQLGEILFGKLGLPGGKKTKTGAYGTSASVLEDLSFHEDLSEEMRDLILKILEWRQLAKLKSTYTDSLQNFVHPQTGRIHTSYAMAATTTGRLASTDPNLQNIPIRTKEGREIRTAFIAEHGCQLISADYSQIELRVLAHIADIAALKQAFSDGLDIHAMTASEMFGVPIDDMDPMVRRRAKAINFGIIYGISAFGLANQLGIARSEAGDYIKMYFERFPGIKDYMEETKKLAHEQGYVQTIFGRTIHYPQINTKNSQQRSFFERAAINAPIQGAAADIIRRAMIRMPQALEGAGFKATKMLLQVHDELIFEAADHEVHSAIHVITETMENACFPAVAFSVPLKVDAQSAGNWDEAH
ncbi:MAG: DNA polymerase I [Pseudomonadota bacterium]